MKLVSFEAGFGLRHVFGGALASVLMGALPCAAADVDSVLVRQQWPWSTDVKVEYRLSNVTDPVNIKVECFNDGVALPTENIDGAINGRTYGLTKADEGVGFFYIDPVKAFGKTQVSFANFTVKLSLSNTDDIDTQPIYRIIDLQTKEVKDLSRADFYNDRGRVYGTYETNFAAIGYSPSRGEEYPYTTSLEDVFIWTGVTNNIEYKTTKLVMRRIPAKGKTFMMGGANDWKYDASDNFSVSVTLSNDYWMAVFETTYMQSLILQGYDASSLSGTSAVIPAYKFTTFAGTEGATYEQIRGKPSSWTSWPEDMLAVGPESALHRMRSNYPGLMFDVPTEAQWEYACRAGTETMYYSGVNPDNTESSHTQDLSSLAWFNAVTNVQVEVGLLSPNAFGLYDMLGNVGELTRDLHDPSTVLKNDKGEITGPPAFTEDMTEPSGWTGDDTGTSLDSAYVLFRGENYGRAYNRVKCSFRRAFYTVGGGWKGRFGARLWLPVE